MSLAPARSSRSARPRKARGPALVCLVLLAAACTSGEADRPVAAAGSRAELLVRRGALQPALVLTGELQATEAAAIIVPRTPILQMQIHWMERNGASVRKGQKVLELDSSQFREGIEDAHLTESRAKNDLLQREARVALELTDLEFEIRQARIHLETAQLRASVPEDLHSRRDYRDRQLALARAEFALAKAEEDLRARAEASKLELDVKRLELEDARQEVRIAEEAIEALTLRAPRDGILVVGKHPIDGRRFQVGDSVWVGLEVLSIPTLTAVKVVASLSDVDDGKIAEGTRAGAFWIPIRIWSSRAALPTLPPSPRSSARARHAAPFAWRFLWRGATRSGSGPVCRSGPRSCRPRSKTC